MRRNEASGRYVVNLDSGDGRKLVCSWDECDRPGTTLHQHYECVHDATASCEAADNRLIRMIAQTAHRTHVFCCDDHRNYFVNAYGRNAQESIARTGRAYGNLPVGIRGGRFR